MESHFDYKSDFDFPSLDNVSHANATRPNSPPDQATGYESSKENRENSSMSRGRGKKQNWKRLHFEFPNSHEQRFPQRGTGRNRFGINNVRTTDEGTENVFRANRNGAQSRNRRTRGGVQHQRRPHSEESLSNPQASTSNVEPNMSVAPIPYTSNYGTYVQPIVSSSTKSAVTSQNVMTAIQLQIEYYFSDKNLETDIYMRMNMTKEGFLPISLIASFKRLTQLTRNRETIAEAIKLSNKLELDDYFVRPIINPLRWPIDSKMLSKMSSNYFPIVESAGPPLRVNVQQFVPVVPVDNTVFQTSQAAVDDSSASSELITNIMGNLTLNTDSYSAYYLRDSQDVNSYQRMFTYVSS